MAVKKVKKRRIAIIAIAAFTVYVLISTIFIYNSIQTKQNKLDSLQTQIEENKILNQEFKELIDEGVDEDYIVKMAREKLGLVFPDERVYVDIAGSGN